MTSDRLPDAQAASMAALLSAGDDDEVVVEAISSMYLDLLAPFWYDDDDELKNEGLCWRAGYIHDMYSYARYARRELDSRSRLITL